METGSRSGLTAIPRNTLKEFLFSFPATLSFAGLRAWFLEEKCFYWGTQQYSC